MSNSVRLLLATILVALPCVQSKAQTNNQQAPCCSIVEQALASVNNIKPGMTRADVEKDFVLDGGLDFIGTSIYTYKKCLLIKIRVDFSIAKPGKNVDSPNDVVKSVSQPYLQYPIRD